MNVNLGNYTLPAQIFDSTYFTDLTLVENTLTKLAGVVELALLPCTLFLQSVVWVVSKHYAFKASPVRAILWVSALAYWFNVILIPLVVLSMMNIPVATGLFPTWQYVAAFLLTILIIAILNYFRFKNLNSSTEALLLRIDKRIEEIISQEKKTSNQRIRTEALLTIKDVFSKLKFDSVDFNYAMISAIFVAIKEVAITKDPQPNRFEALEAETNQASTFLARSLA